MKYVAGFGRFWYDFIVGDSWVLALGGLALLALGYGLTQANASTVAEVVLPISVVGTVWTSLKATK